MIQRFEDEYPETRLSTEPIPDTLSDNASISSSLEHSHAEASALEDQTLDPAFPDPEDDINDPLIRPASISRRASSPSLASRQAQEEGRMHRFGQQIKRDMLKPRTEDFANGTTGTATDDESEYMQDLRRRLESLDGSKIQESIKRLGPEAIFDAIEATAEELAVWEQKDPEGFRKIKEAQAAALKAYKDQQAPPVQQEEAIS